MTTSVARMSPESAPRDAASLLKLGIFQIRLLIEACGGLQDADSKTAFAKMTPDQKVALALQLLADFDRQRGVAPATMSPPPQQNGMANGQMMAPPQQAFQQPQMAPQQPQMAPQQQYAPASMQMMPPPSHQQEVNPGQVAAAAGAVERTPSNKQTKKSSDPDLVASVLAQLQQLQSTVVAQGEAFNAGMRELRDAVAELQRPTGMEQSIKNLEQSYGGVYTVLTNFAQHFMNLQNTQELSLSLALFMAEQVLGAPREDVLRSALADVPAIRSLLNAAPGKG